MAEKLFILDTNVLLEDPKALSSFGAVRIGIPIIIFEELDHMKSEPSFRGRNAREVIRIFDQLRTLGNLKDGVQLENGAIVQILFAENSKDQILLERHENNADNKILLIAKLYQQKGYDIEFFSRDINLRIKADLLNIKASDYKTELIDEKTIYRGWRILQVSPTQFKKELPDDLREVHKENPFKTNEFVILKSGSSEHNLKLFRYTGNSQFKLVEAPDLKWSLHPRNIQQKMALDILFDDSIQLVSLMGPAGTGKTFLTLVAALHEILVNEHFEKVLITRPVVPLGPDIGFLPGDIREKLHIWMQPIYDNMDYILHSAGKSQELGVYREPKFEKAFYEHKKYHGKDRYKDKYEHREKRERYKSDKYEYKKHKNFLDQGLPDLDNLIEENKVSMEAITYMRGRSIPYQFIIIDEVQNLTPHEVKTLISRVGEGSKIVLTGDPYQIDAAHLDFNNNGLIVTNERFKGQPIFASVFLEITERSELSRLAAELL
jgi:PhoH-like ATPase